MPHLKDLRHDQCRYPVTQESPFIFCGRTRAEGSSYCARHHALCVKKKMRPIEFLAEWVNKNDLQSAPARGREADEVQPLDEVLT